MNNIFFKQIYKTINKNALKKTLRINLSYTKFFKRN